MTHHPKSTSNLPFKTMKALSSCFIRFTVGAHSPSPKWDANPGQTESNALAVRLAGLILNGSSNISIT